MFQILSNNNTISFKYLLRTMFYSKYHFNTISSDFKWKIIQSKAIRWNASHFIAFPSVESNSKNSMTPENLLDFRRVAKENLKLKGFMSLLTQANRESSSG